MRVAGGREFHDAEADVRRMYGLLKDRLGRKEELRMGEEEQQREDWRNGERKDGVFGDGDKPAAWEGEEVTRTWIKNLEEGGDSLWGCI